MKFEFSRQIFRKKFSSIKFHENPSSGSRVVPCRVVPCLQTEGRRDKDNRTRLKMKARQVKDRKEEGGNKVGIKET